MLRTSPCVLSKQKPVSPSDLHVFTIVKTTYLEIIRFYKYNIYIKYIQHKCKSGQN